MTEVAETFQKGLLALYNEKFEEAEKNFRSVLDPEPNHISANFYLGTVLQIKQEPGLAAGHFDTAIKHAEAVLARNKLDADAHFYRGAAYGAKALLDWNPLNLLKYQRIFFEEMDFVLNMQPDYWQALWFKGRALALTGRESEAGELFQKALKISELADIHIDLALIYLKQKNAPLSEKHLLRAKALKPESPTVAYHLSQLEQVRQK